MTTSRKPLTRVAPLPTLHPKRIITPLKSSLVTVQPILPDIVSSSLPSKPRNKKRVRFALKLDPVEEHALENSAPDSPVAHSEKPRVEPWREDGSLFGAYVQYLEEKDSSKPNPSPSDNRPNTPVPDFETSATFTQIYNVGFDHQFTNLPSSTNQLPRLAQQNKTGRKPVRKPPSPVMEYHLQRRMNTPVPPQPVQGKRIAYPTISRMVLSPTAATSRRNELALPVIKSPTSVEKVIRTDQPVGSKLVNDYFQTKKVTEIIANPLAGANNQISYICGHSVLPTLRKPSPTHCHSPLTHQPFFYQNHEHVQPILHPTH